ncbi:MAG: HAD family hydrolase [Bacteroidetes bacterium]|nr:HAD family hydrolase [Bacteroidota bacterium]
MKRKAIFFDRDGVVNFRIVGKYIKSAEDFRFMPDFIEFFKKIKTAGYLTILITNQQGIGKGLMTEKELETVHNFMQSKLKEFTGNNFDDIYYSSELAENNSFRRKPNPGMLLEAIEKWDIDIENSWMIGDRKSDVKAGKRAGLKTILLKPVKNGDFPEADFLFRNLDEVYTNLFNKLLS